VVVAEQHAQGTEQKPQPVEHGGSMPPRRLAVLTDGLLASYSSQAPASMSARQASQAGHGPRLR
jgi:hypothetical protein